MQERLNITIITSLHELLPFPHQPVLCAINLDLRIKYVLILYEKSC